MNRIMHYAGYLGRYLRGTRGVAAMEYAIIVGLVVVGVGVAVAAFQDNIVALIENASTKVSGQATAVKSATD